MTIKRTLTRHSYSLDHISNPKISGGGVKTENIPYLSGYYLDDLMEIGEAEIIFPNSWVKAGSKNVLLRNLFSKYDIIQIWRDKVVVFTGLIADDMELTFSTIKVKLKSNIFLLTEQYTGVESYTEEPSNSVKRFLKWWNYSFKDNFNRTSLGDDWTVVAGNVTIDANKLSLAGSGGYNPQVRRTATLSNWIQDFELNFKMSEVPGVTLITIRPDSAGDTTELTPSAGANWQNVDEATSDEDVTYNYTTSSTSGFRMDLYNLSASGLGAGDSINGLTIKARVRCPTPSGGDLVDIYIKQNGQMFHSGRMATTSDYMTFEYRWPVNPATQNQWTQAEVDALQAGVELSTWAASRITQLEELIEKQQPELKIKFPYIDASNEITLDFRNVAGSQLYLEKIVGGVSRWKVESTKLISPNATIKVTRLKDIITIYIDGISEIEKIDNRELENQPGYLLFRGEAVTGINAYFDDVILKIKEQVITEGTINSFGTTKTTSVSYETLYNAIDKRVRTQLNSTDSLATTWEWKENHLTFDANNPTNPRASLDFKNRIGTNKDVTLSIKEKNISDAKTRFAFSQFKTNLIALGAGTTAVGAQGQPVYESYDFDSYDEIGMILQTLYQLSDETNYSNLVTLAGLWLGKYKDIQENIAVDPIDYENKGFSVGDGYVIDIPELLTDKSTYYRIMSEKREFSPDGAEKITVNWKYKQRSFLREVEKLYRESVNKARYNQGTYVTQNYVRDDESVAAAAKTTKNKTITFRDGIHSGVKLVNWNVYCSDSSVPWSIWVDSTDRTNSIFGSATVTGNRNNIDLTQYMTSIGDHTIEVRNDHATTAYTFASYGDAELWVR